MIWGVVTFPGSNCDRDCVHVLRDVLAQDVREVWHEHRSLAGLDAVVLPGGFSYGDYLRAGAIAATAPVMVGVREAAHRGAVILGICNGFQILTEAGLLPGTLLPNRYFRFICRDIWVRVETTRTPFTQGLRVGDLLRMPIAHAEGRYMVPAEARAQLENHAQVVFRYVDARGRAVPSANPNGAVRAIAGVCNAQGNVVGLMPHPERCAESLMGSTDGRRLFESVAASVLTAMAGV